MTSVCVNCGCIGSALPQKDGTKICEMCGSRDIRKVTDKELEEAVWGR